jgi:hypothetical protein
MHSSVATKRIHALDLDLDSAVCESDYEGISREHRVLVVANCMSARRVAVAASFFDPLSLLHDSCSFLRMATDVRRLE